MRKKYLQCGKNLYNEIVAEMRQKVYAVTVRKGNDKMNVNKLKAKCIEKGINIVDLSKQVEISQSAFYRRLKEDSFSVEEVRRIAECLELNQQDITDIFFEGIVA